MYSNFKPINDGVLVKVSAQDTKTSGGIIIPDSAQEKTQVGVVIHPGRSTQLQVNDNVFYKKYIGHQLDDQYIVLREEDILGVL
jgi:chaperonin GroES